MLSMRRHANFIKRFKSVSCLFTASILFPMPISAAVSDYDALVIEARGGNSAPLLRFLEDQGKKSALTPNQVADWLQVSSWVAVSGDRCAWPAGAVLTPDAVSDAAASG